MKKVLRDRAATCGAAAILVALTLSPAAALDRAETNDRAETVGPALAVPDRIPFQGFLQDGGGDPLPGPVDIKAEIFDKATGGGSLWGPESHLGVPLESGVFSIQLGRYVPLPLPIFGPTDLWLQITVGGGTALPRTELLTTPFAMRAAIADAAEVAIADDGDWMVAGPDLVRVTGDIGIGTGAPAARLDVRGPVNVGADTAGHDFNVYGQDTGSRLFWDEDKMALRFGRDQLGNWDPGNVGSWSFAGGVNTNAGGQASFAFGIESGATGGSSVSMGDFTFASGYASVAMGSFVTATASRSLVFGAGPDLSVPLVNNIPSSFMVGFGREAPTFLVRSDQVGIGTETTLLELLHVEDDGGAMYLHNDGTPTFTGGSTLGVKLKNDNAYDHGFGSQNLGDGGGYVLLATHEGSTETGGFYADGDAVVIWSPGDRQLVNFCDEDAFNSTGTTVYTTARRAYIDTGGNFVTVSDARHKENVQPVENALDRLRRVEGVSYDFKREAEEIAKGDAPRRGTGFLAQELVKHVPEAVQIDEAGLHYVNYAAMIPVLVEALKEQQEEIDELKRQLAGR